MAKNEKKLNVRPQKTAEDLLSEMEAWINDNPDDHDLIITEYKRHMTLMVVGPPDLQEDQIPPQEKP